MRVVCWRGGMGGRGGWWAGGGGGEVALSVRSVGVAGGRKSRMRWRWEGGSLEVEVELK